VHVQLVATDPLCPPVSCCAEQSVEASTRPGCFVHALWTFNYCCSTGPRLDCYRWGEDSPGYDLVVHTAISGVQCRHLCQSHEACVYWTYLVDAPQLPDGLRGQCYLKGDGAVKNPVQAHPFVVSGERICTQFGEGMPRADAAARPGLDVRVQGTLVPWRTAAGSLSAAAAAGYAVLASAGTNQWHVEAAELVRTLGFVVVLDALDPGSVRRLRQSVKGVSDLMLSHDRDRIGNRGPRRYSYGGASQTLHMVHVQEWAGLVDNAAVNAVLPHVFPQGYLAVGGGGDFVLGSTSTYQSLHLDVGGGPIYDLGVPPAVGANFVVDDLTCADAPLRIVVGSHSNPDNPPSLMTEAEDLKASVICPLPAGSVIIRDLRAWHGGTPSGSGKDRYMPNAEYVSLQWGQLTCGTGQILDPCQPVLPKSLYEQMSPLGRAISESIVDRSGMLDHLMRDGEWLRKDFAHFERHQAHVF